METIAAFLTLLAAMVAQGEGEGAATDPEVVALLGDLEEPLLARAGRAELVALGEVAAGVVVERCLWPPRDAEGRQFTLWLPLLQEMGARARPALQRALAVAQDATEGDTTRARARFVVEGLALAVGATEAELAPMLAGSAGARLRARLALGAQPPAERLGEALAASEFFALEAALEIVARAGERAGFASERVLALWDAREDLACLQGIDPVSPDHPEARAHLADLIAATLVAVAPKDARAAAAHARLLDQPACSLGKIDRIACIAALGLAAGDAVPALARACVDFDESVCRAALDAVARLGRLAAAAEPAVRECAEGNHDTETKRIARAVLRRLTTQDVEGRVSDLIADLWHPVRWRGAVTELAALGPAAAPQVVDEYLSGGTDLWLWSRLLQAFGPGLDGALLARVQPIRDRDAWRLSNLVDAAVDSTVAVPTAARLRSLAASDPARAATYERLLERLADQSALPADAPRARLIEVLAEGSDLMKARAARLLRRRGEPLDEATHARLSQAQDRPWLHDWDERALSIAGAFEFEATLALVELAPRDPTTFTAYEALLRRWIFHDGLRIELLGRLAGTEVLPDAVVRRIAGSLQDNSAEVAIAAAGALARLGPRAASAVPQLEAVAALRYNRVAARSAALALRTVRGGTGR